MTSSQTPDPTPSEDSPDSVARNPITGEPVPFFKKADTQSMTPDVINALDQAAPKSVIGGKCEYCGTSTPSGACETCAAPGNANQLPSTVATADEWKSTPSKGQPEG